MTEPRRLFTPGTLTSESCEPCNRCIAVMYFGEARCTEAERLLAGRQQVCPVVPPPAPPGPAVGPSATL